MRTRLLAFTLAFVFAFNFSGRADEGMWLPFLLGKKYEEMKALGLKLTPEQLYDVNNASLKDAIVMLDGGNCTGEMISSQGLLLTNHHCGYGEIQAHSSVENDYLTNGFWAYNMNEELANPTKSASFLVRIEDVSTEVLAAIGEVKTEAERGQAVRKISGEISKKATEGTHFNAQVKSMFSGNEYYLFVYETFRDVRLVGAPPSSIGKYGGDTDNWVWPRHTGDFTLFRVYMGPDGKPADYSKDNVPYQPKHHLPVSLKGVEKNDYAMIWGYPGTTDRYLCSYGVAQKMDELNPVTVKLRDTKMKIMKKEMNKDPKVRIQYASKIAYLGNFWKKDAEESKALRKLKVVDQKAELEKQYLAWANEEADRKAKYGNVVADFEEVYKVRTEKQYSKAWWYIIEATYFQGAEILTFARTNQQLYGALTAEKAVDETIAGLKEEAKALYKDYNATIDQNIVAAMLEAYYQDIPKELQPEIFQMVEKKFKGDFNKFAAWVFKKSIFSSEEKYYAFLENPKAKKLMKDPAMLTVNSLFEVFFKLRGIQSESDDKLAQANRLFIDGVRQMNNDRFYYPNANSTMRCTYGIVNNYIPRDAVEYDLITYLSGVMEKEDPDNEEFIVAPKLKELYEAKDFGEYGVNGKMPVCFLTNHDITGGNSGSPVINANGEIIGTAFDGNSEAMSSDIQFNPDLQRTIICDIRYVLFVIDKYAGATNLIEEMDIVK